MKFSRRDWLWALAAGAWTSFGRSAQSFISPPSRSATQPPADALLPVLTRRVLIPAPGATLPALLCRPDAAGVFPAAVLLPGLAAAESSEATARRLAGQGRLVLTPLPRQFSGQLSARQLEALHSYLRAHSCSAGEPGDIM